jgi:hypothetical protein
MIGGNTQPQTNVRLEGQPSIGNVRPHGGVRGDDQTPGSPLFEGRFGRMFRRLPAAQFEQADLDALADAMTADPEAEPTPEDQVDDEENQGIDAGYTYLGQFIDHDLTFDPNSSLQRFNDPNSLTNFRTPRFDLDSVYGRGSDDQPYMYEEDGVRLRLGRSLSGSDFDPNPRDLPRFPLDDANRARALIGDPRNDENVIASQLQGIMLRFHNRVAALLGATGKQDLPEVQRAVRWHYQWVVVHDFLPTIVGTETMQNVLPHLTSHKSIYDDPPKIHFFKWENEPFIPIEFSVAAYRFGHSMIRPIYRLNTNLKGTGAVNGRQFIFTPDDSREGLNGFRAFPDIWAIDWRLFFDTGDRRGNVGVDRLQKSYKIDTSVVNPLKLLPKSIAADVRSLAQRNLERGWRMSLPNGQDVARYMDLKPVAPEHLRVGKATAATMQTNKLITDISPAFKDNAPLWYYVLAEAQQQFKEDKTPIRLGAVGGRIVAEVFVGLLLGDHHSYLSQNPHWRPHDGLLNPATNKFEMADLIKAAIGVR